MAKALPEEFYLESAKNQLEYLQAGPSERYDPGKNIKGELQSFIKGATQAAHSTSAELSTDLDDDSDAYAGRPHAKNLCRHHNRNVPRGYYDGSSNNKNAGAGCRTLEYTSVATSCDNSGVGRGRLQSSSISNDHGRDYGNSCFGRGRMHSSFDLEKRGKDLKLQFPSVIYNPRSAAPSLAKELNPQVDPGPSADTGAIRKVKPRRPSQPLYSSPKNRHAITNQKNPPAKNNSSTKTSKKPCTISDRPSINSNTDQRPTDRPKTDESEWLKKTYKSPPAFKKPQVFKKPAANQDLQFVDSKRFEITEFESGIHQPNRFVGDVPHYYNSSEIAAPSHHVNSLFVDTSNESSHLRSSGATNSFNANISAEPYADYGETKNHSNFVGPSFYFDNHTYQFSVVSANTSFNDVSLGDTGFANTSAASYIYPPNENVAPFPSNGLEHMKCINHSHSNAYAGYARRPSQCPPGDHYNTDRRHPMYKYLLKICPQVMQCPFFDEILQENCDKCYICACNNQHIWNMLTYNRLMMNMKQTPANHGYSQARNPLINANLCTAPEIVYAPEVRYLPCDARPGRNAQACECTCQSRGMPNNGCVNAHQRNAFNQAAGGYPLGPSNAMQRNVEPPVERVISSSLLQHFGNAMTLTENDSSNCDLFDF